MRREVDAERCAAREELAQLEDREREVAGDAAVHRADDEVVRLLADVRRAIVGAISLRPSPSSDPPNDGHVNVSDRLKSPPMIHSSAVRLGMAAESRSATQISTFCCVSLTPDVSKSVSRSPGIGHAGE